eukprot:m.269131 g.269131  ORF g.269131 m.269131 type:complete len:58 (-) comp82357_c0_seq1:2-175(-)
MTRFTPDLFHGVQPHQLVWWRCGGLVNLNYQTMGTSCTQLMANVNVFLRYTVSTSYM